MPRFQKTTWSSLELDYLKKHKSHPVNQLSAYMAKSHYAIKKKLKELESPSSTKKTSGPTMSKRSKIGKRPDCGGLFFRSSWESNFYRYLKTLKNVKLIEYEPTTFSFTYFGILKGTVSYTPDFKVTYKDGSYEFVEIKGGWMQQKDKTKIRRFQKFYPDEFKRLVAVTPGEKSKTYLFFKEMGVEVKWKYPDLNRQYKKTIPHWE